MKLQNYLSLLWEMTNNSYCGKKNNQLGKYVYYWKSGILIKWKNKLNNMGLLSSSIFRMVPNE